jgi:hypothetical protein
MHGYWQRFAIPLLSPLLRSTSGTQFRRQYCALNLEYPEDRRLLSADVTYHGGPLLQNVQIETLFYGQSWTTDANLQQLLSQANGLLQQQIAADFVGSQAYFQSLSASDWLSSIYQSSYLVHRISPVTRAGWPC